MAFFYWFIEGKHYWTKYKFIDWRLSHKTFSKFLMSTPFFFWIKIKQSNAGIGWTKSHSQIFSFLYLSILLDKQYYWKVIAELWTTPGFLASGKEEFDPGPVARLDHSESLCNKVLLRCKRDRQSFWPRHQKRAERVPPSPVSFSKLFYVC